MQRYETLEKIKLDGYVEEKRSEDTLGKGCGWLDEGECLESRTHGRISYALRSVYDFVVIVPIHA